MSRRTLPALPYPRIRRASLLVAGAAILALAASAPASAASRPAKPTNLRVVTTTTESVTLTWKRTARRFAVSKNSRRVALITARRYTFRNLRCGRSFRFGVRAINRFGRRSTVAVRYASTRPCPPVPHTPVPPSSVQQPTVAGTARVGRLLSTTNGIWSGSTPMAYAYEWLRCDSAGASCATVAGATGPTYLLAAGDVGSTFRARVTASNAYGTAQATSDPSAVVASQPVGTTTCTGGDIAYASTAPGSTAQIVFDLGQNVYPCGQFANGDWFVVGPAVIRDITPSTTGSGSSLRHGVDVNPSVTSGNAQRWDGRLSSLQGPVVSFPYTAQPGQSIVKYVSSNPGGSCLNGGCGRFAAVLTVLAAAPASPSTTFRPPYWGSYKPLISTDALDLGLLSRRSSSCCRDKITRSEALFRTRHLRLDTSPSSIDGGGGLEPLEAYADGRAWGGDVLKFDMEVAFWLLLDDACASPPCTAAADQAAKLPVLIGFVQNGIDLWGGTRGGLVHLRGGGGNAAGKLFLEAFAATFLRDAAMAADLDAADDRIFWETFSLYRGVNGTALWGQMYFNNDRAAWERSYWDDLKDCTNCSTRDPYGLVDGGARPGTSYQRATMLPTKYMGLFLELVPQTAAYWPGLHENVIKDYAKRVVSSGAITIPDSCAPKQGTYGVHYGPDGRGDCIRQSQGPSGGRVPEYDGTTVDGQGTGSRRSDFGDQMWTAFH